MTLPSKYTLLALLCLTIFLPACVPPWYGEEDNYPIVALTFVDSLENPISLQGADVTALTNLHYNRPLPFEDPFAQDHMNFDSRLDPAYDLILPLDKAHPFSNFAITRGTQTDTIQFFYQYEEGQSRRGKFDVNINPNTIHYVHTFDSLTLTSYPNHPQILLHLYLR